MLNTKKLRIGNLLNGTRGVCVITALNIEKGASFRVRAWGLNDSPFGNCDNFLTPIELNKEWARDLGFTITDFGDYWEFERNGFILVQFKLKTGVKVKDLVPSYILQSLKPKHIKVQHVHKLQNLYFEIMEEELIYKPL